MKDKFVEAKSIPKKSTRKAPGKPFVRFNLKMLYISAEAMAGFQTDYIGIKVNAPGNAMLITKASAKTATSFKLCRVCSTEGARRIETNNALLSLIDAGFPRYMLGKRLPVSRSLDGALIVDLRPQIPMAGIQMITHGSV